MVGTAPEGTSRAGEDLCTCPTRSLGLPDTCLLRIALLAPLPSTCEVPDNQTPVRVLHWSSNRAALTGIYWRISAHQASRRKLGSNYSFSGPVVVGPAPERASPVLSTASACLAIVRHSIRVGFPSRVSPLRPLDYNYVGLYPT